MRFSISKKNIGDDNPAGSWTTLEYQVWRGQIPHRPYFVTFNFDDFKITEEFQGYILSTSLNTVDDNFDHPAEVVFISEVILFFLFSILNSLEGSLYVQLILKEWGRMLYFLEDEVHT